MSLAPAHHLCPGHDCWLSRLISQMDSAIDATPPFERVSLADIAPDRIEVWELASATDATPPFNMRDFLS